MNRFAVRGLNVLKGAGSVVGVVTLTTIGGVAEVLEKAVPVVVKSAKVVATPMKKGVAKVQDARVNGKAREVLAVEARVEELRNQQ